MEIRPVSPKAGTKVATTTSEQELQLRYKFRLKAVDSCVSIVNAVIKWGSLAFIAFMGRDSIFALAGKTTTAVFLADFGQSIELKEVITYTVGLLGVIYGLYERNTRQKKTQYLGDEIKKLELLLDPKRSSSKLTARGTTRPEDDEP
jgi:sulfite exporter TauE/SafE